MHVMLTRPRTDSDALAAHLRSRGHDVHLEPMLEIDPTGAEISLNGVQAILATSANGIRCLATTTDRRDLPLYAVGDATADCARGAGFEAVHSAHGDSQALLALVVARLDPSAGKLIHVRGMDATGDLSGALEASGFAVEPAILYKATKVDLLSETGRNFISGEKIDSILFFSPRTARTFVSLVNEAGLRDHCTYIAALCLSQAVADAAKALSWRDVRIAATPDQLAMIRILDELKTTEETKQL